MPISFRSKHEAGFSLMEMLLVLVILGMAAGLVAGRIRAPGVDWEAASLAAFLREMRADAMVNGHRLDAALEPAPLRLVVSRGEGEFRFAQASEVTAQSFSFHRDGGSSGTVITVRRNAESYAVQVEALTGRVSRVR
ncbi:MAG: prepilin-type N-terminal cleavage/methylation domain-containing protein [Aestuariivirgaceae bacterium]|nr:prepilin-type N-terminal cleavage/methylation domain-containing protein [Aestuariivirgaceae bacterium]